jgi:tRNA-splicing ligase RtcB
MIHCGSRGFGHQVATDYLKIFGEAMPKYKISVPDPQLAAAPFNSAEGQDYFEAMAAAVNIAFANRQVIMHNAREVFTQVFGKSGDLGLNLIYDVAHNIAKKESHETGDRRQELIVHRKGATRSFPNQPVIIGGSMETGSHLMVGTEEAMKLSFGSTAHGSGRKMSRAEAKRKVRGEKLQKELKERGIYIRSASMPGLAEEAGLAYKDVNEVVEAVHQAGLSKKVASFTPIGNIKG